MFTPIKPDILPPPPDPRLHEGVRYDAALDDYFVEHTPSDVLIACMQKAFSAEGYIEGYLTLGGQVLSWNALHVFLGEVVAQVERNVGMPDHSQRVSHIALRCGVALGLQPADLNELYWGGALHDIGKLAADQAVLKKPTALSPYEWQLIREHPLWGHRILKQVLKSEAVAEVALTHHEHWDGGGYPRGLRGEDIPLHGRIVAVADTFDALTSARAYKRAVLKNVALKIIEGEAGHQLDPVLVRRLLDGDVFYRIDLKDQPDVG